MRMIYPGDTYAFDLDDSLNYSAEPWVEFVNDQLGTALTVDDYTEDLHAMMGTDPREAQRVIDAFYSADVFAEFRPREEAIPVLEELRSNDVGLVITTSRRISVAESTIKWVRRNFKGIFKEIYFAGIYDGPVRPEMIYETKEDLYRGLRVAGALDDQKKHAYAAARVSGSGVLIGNFAWNQTDDPLPPNVTRAADWQEVGAHFDERLAA